MRFVDLFAGLGGFHLALDELEHTCVFASELDETLQSVYQKNFNIKPFGDIREVPMESIPEHDILCAGFPCQPFSKAGYQNGFSDRERGGLFYNMLEIIDNRKPKYLLFENVPNIMKHDGGRTWEKMKAELEGRGYYVDHRALSPHYFGIPQIRLREYIVGCRDPLTNMVWPERDRALEKATSIKNVLDEHPRGAQQISSQMRKCIDVWQEFLDKVPKDEKIPHPLWSMEFGATYPYDKITPSVLTYEQLITCKYRGSFGKKLKGDSEKEVFDMLPSYARGNEKRFPNWKIQMIRRNRDFYQKHKKWLDDWKHKIEVFPSSFQKLEWNCQGEPNRNIRDYVLQFRASGVRVKRLGTSPSLVAMTATQVPVVGWEERFMTVEECKKLQSMNSLDLSSMSKSKAYEALGNAVNVQVAKSVAEALLKCN